MMRRSDSQETAQISKIQEFVVLRSHRETGPDILLWCDGRVVVGEPAAGEPLVPLASRGLPW